MLWPDVASALEGLRVTLEVAIWAYDSVDNDFGIKNVFTKYLKDRFLFIFISVQSVSPSYIYVLF